MLDLQPAIGRKRESHGRFGLALAGPRRYGGVLIDDAWMNAGGRTEATPADIDMALRLLMFGWSVLAASVAIVASISA
jgi:adenosylcobinamide-phosphate synthase